MFNIAVPQQRRKQIRIGVWACPHPKSDLNNGRDSISETIKNMENGEGITTDAVFILGDFSHNQYPPTLVDEDDIDGGEDIVRQFATGLRYGREHYYTIRGNHDGGDLNNDWFNRYIDSFGENTVYSGVDNSLRPYPIIRDGVNEDHYAIVIGNILFLMINDCNDVLAPVGRSGGGSGGYPSGTISTLSWAWMQQMIIDYPNHTVIVCHHNLLKDTTIATGDNEGVNGGYHGASGQSVASGRIENIYNRTDDTYTDSSAIISYMNANNGKIWAWFGGHTHYIVGENYASRGGLCL